MPPPKGADRAGLHARHLPRPGGLVRGRGRPVPGGAAPGRQLATARPPRHPAARVCPGRHVQDPDPVPSRDRTGAPPAGQQLHQRGPAWLAQDEADRDRGGPAGASHATRRGGDPCRLGGLAGRAGGTLHLARRTSAAAHAPRMGQPDRPQECRHGALALPAGTASCRSTRHSAGAGGTWPSPSSASSSDARSTVSSRRARPRSASGSSRPHMPGTGGPPPSSGMASVGKGGESDPAMDTLSAARELTPSNRYQLTDATPTNGIAQGK